MSKEVGEGRTATTLIVMTPGSSCDEDEEKSLILRTYRLGWKGGRNDGIDGTFWHRR